jgi:hypothetical protein
MPRILSSRVTKNEAYSRCILFDIGTPVRTKGESKCVSIYRDLGHISTVKFVKMSCFSDYFVDLSDLDDLKVNKVSCFPFGPFPTSER